MTLEKIYEYAKRKQELAIKNNNSVEYYKTSEYLGVIIQDIVNNLNVSCYYFNKIRSMMSNSLCKAIK